MSTHLPTNPTTTIDKCTESHPCVQEWKQSREHKNDEKMNGLHCFTENTISEQASREDNNILLLACQA